MTAADYDLRTPQGTDLISQGDDAIRHNAERTATLFDQLRYPRSPLGASSSIDSLDTGVHFRVGSIATEQGWPVSRSTGSAVVEVPYDDGTNGLQDVTLVNAEDTQSYSRRRVGGTWGNWYKLGYAQGLLPVGADLNSTTTPGTHQVTASRPALNSPAGWEGTSFTLEVLPMGTSWLMQRATNAEGAQVTRFRRGASEISWDETWTSTGPGASQGVGLQARMAVESTGQWTNVAEFRDYLTLLAEHPDIELLDIGETVNGAPTHQDREDSPAHYRAALPGREKQASPGHQSEERGSTLH